MYVRPYTQYFVTEAVVGFERSVIGGEDQGMVQVCVNIFTPNVSCPVAFPFELIITTSDGTAGKHQQILSCRGKYNL